MAGINHIASILTPQNVNAIERYSPELGRIAKTYGTLAHAAVRPQQYVERTGRTANVLKDLDSGISGVTQTVLNAAANSTAGAVVGGAGGDCRRNDKSGGRCWPQGGGGEDIIHKKRPYAIEKASNEAIKAARSGYGQAARDAAERRFLAGRKAVAAIRDAVGIEDFNRLMAAGIVAALSGERSD